MIRKLLTLTICIVFSALLCGCSVQSNTDINEISISPENLLLSKSETINISNLQNSGGIFDNNNDLGFALIKFQGSISEENIGFTPDTIEITGNNVGFLAKEPTVSDTSDNPYLLAQAYSFNKTEEKTFTLYVKVPINDAEADVLVSNPDSILDSIEIQARERLDNKTITISNERDQSKTYLLIDY